MGHKPRSRGRAGELKQGAADSVSSQSLSNAATAAGRRFLVEGFSFSAQDDLLFALGFPHLILLDAAEGADEEPVANALALLEAWRCPLFIPTRTLTRMCRVWGERGFQHTRGGGPMQLTDAGRRAIENDAPIGDDEARGWIEELFDDPRWAQLPREQFYGTEALVGSTVVVDGALSAMSSWSETTWLEQDRGRFEQMLHLGMAMWRLPAQGHERVRKRLDSMRPGAPIEPVEPHHLPSAHHGIALALEGAPAAQKICAKAASVLSFGDLSHAFGNREYVRRAVSNWDYPAGIDPDARRVFVGGEDVLDVECSWWSKYRTPGAVSTIIRTYGLIRSPKTIELMLSILGKGKARRAVMSWFRDHWSYAQPIIETAARKQPRGAAATVLEGLG